MAAKTLTAVMPWEKIAWSEEHQQILYRDWGLYYTHKQQLDIAAKYYDKSLSIKEHEPYALHYRSICKRDIGQTKGALKDALHASAIAPKRAPIKMGVCDALYELNEFEDCAVELHDNVRRYVGNKAAQFKERIIVVDENLNDSIGDTLGPFILLNEKKFPAVLEDIKARTNKDERPLWKILKEQAKCDVQSILEKKQNLLSPREIARRERSFMVFNQMYFRKGWIDVLFLRKLRTNKSMLLPQAKISTPYLKDLTANKYDAVRKFLKMLHARSPMYNEYMVKCPDKRMWQRHREAHLHRVQYQTRRNMLTILRSIKEIRKSGKVQHLSRYIESVMGDYVVLKTHRVMPWKFEFMNEVYNTLALAHIDRYTNIPPNVKNMLLQKHTKQDKMLLLLRLPNDKFKDNVTNQIYKLFLSRLEKRMHFAKYGIERCYLLHEMSRCHLSQGHMEECCSTARRAIEEAKRNNCPVWQFLCNMLIVKTHAILKKVEYCKEAIKSAKQIAITLKCPKLKEFMSICKLINEEDLAIRRHKQSSSEYTRKGCNSGSQNSHSRSSMALSKKSTEQDTVPPTPIQDNLEDDISDISNFNEPLMALKKSKKGNDTKLISNKRGRK